MLTIICRWLGDRVLRLDPEPTFTVMEQSFTGPDGVHHVRRGFIALVGVEPYESLIVRRHERTRPGPVAGRLLLLEGTRSHLSPIFGLYRNHGGDVQATLDLATDGRPADAEVTDRDGTRHRTWAVTATPELTSLIEHRLAETSVLIADGHHRYETALAYHRARGSCPSDPSAYLPVYLVEAGTPGLTIYPTHRVVDGVSTGILEALPRLLEAQGLEVREVADATTALDPSNARAAAGIVRPGGLADLLVAGETGPLDTELVQERILGPILDLTEDLARRSDRITYLHRSAEAVARTRAAPDRLGIIVRAPSIATVEALAGRGATLPAKSTYFYPKTLDGFVFHQLDDCL